ncbi:rRNA maturation RNase YbeY [Fodinibius sediminis]|uniref:Endoribonuclease YbeY n=1 Tax=Fodinibius sediminis TaxID=1214077 RepID=A0A521CQY9_9BACT|nr:rRNA maturation RNase YbeY [Fodinibius sediminis]SMO61853.1 rRNA maturation RNase YbeY [Fodinibius sediminis]
MAAPSHANIEVFNETDNRLPISRADCQAIVTLIMQHEDCSFRFVEVVYVDEEEIIRINKEYLDRGYVTDIISFRYDETDDNEEIEGTLFCCLPRIREQAHEFNQSEKKEFQRILIHGLLHLVGYDDQSDDDKKNMSSRENFYLDHI